MGNDNSLLTSPITMEPFTSLQEKVSNQDHKLNRIDILLNRISVVILKEDNSGGQPMSSEEDEAGGTKGTSGTLP